MASQTRSSKRTIDAVEPESPNFVRTSARKKRPTLKASQTMLPFVPKISSQLSQISTTRRQTPDIPNRSIFTGIYARAFRRAFTKVTYTLITSGLITSALITSALITGLIVYALIAAQGYYRGEEACGLRNRLRMDWPGL
jgi:hypothetical protein